VIDALASKLTPKVASNYEKAIYNMCLSLAADQDVDTVYRAHAYEKVGEILVCADRSAREKVLADIRKGVVGRDSASYADLREKTELEAKLFAEGVKVKRGDFECKRCKSKECYYYQQQTRSADEGLTTYVFCTKCDYKGKMA